ncbi:hypothetical protein GPECTOR_2g1345 [Gonium pectorale]|uniref:FAS1 domain-containing protein n=1 Tax=Gonium pectorale TaxID=33097 RepID=A0A150H150_GONPE|nr:hypothetical protein GPECTOR_2g1345 [Gonium pectorale]|eukprot:KXZ55795.1 hypothetical protein GPECTOR_2g1345 [Gonium pectorale]
MGLAVRRRLGLSAAVLCIVLLTLGSQCLGSEAAGPRSIGEIRVAGRRALLQDAPQTDLAVEALNATGTGTTLTNETVATIFAPTDAAFEALAAALNLTSPLDLFNATYNATAANITALHVIPGELLTAANITELRNITAPSLLGYNLTIFVEPNGTVSVTVPGSDVIANVVTADVPFNSSIVHVIDKVLLPPANETATWAIPLPASAP